MLRPLMPGDRNYEASRAYHAERGRAIPTFDEWAVGIDHELARLRWPWQRKRRAELRKVLADGHAAQDRHEENMRRYNDFMAERRNG